MTWRRPLLCSAVALFVTPTIPPPILDLDVGIPPGSPTAWGRRFPSITPRGGPLFAITPRAKKGPANGDPKQTPHTVAHPVEVPMNVHISTSYGVVRILTWDLEGHLRWVSRTPRAKSGPVTGPRPGQVVLPPVADGLYWANMASLLRLLLHPQLVSEQEMIAHLVEVGEPVLAALDNSVAESALEAPSKTIRRMVGATVGGNTPLAGKTPRDTMLRRFLAEELVKAYPYDPEGGFGRRFFLFADELEGAMVQYAREHTGVFLRRNATSALGRYGSMKASRALCDLAASTRDPVVLTRALAALGTFRTLPKDDRERLLKRMMAVTDPVEKIAFVTAASTPEAVPYLLRLARSARNRDMLQAVLATLIATPLPPGEAAVTAFAKNIALRAGSRPEQFQVAEHGGTKPDAPDTPRMRGEIMHQLALFLQARVGKAGNSAAKKVLAMVQKPGAAPKRPPRGPRGRPVARRTSYPNTSMSGVQPPAQMLFLETLKLLGDPGQDALAQIAADSTVDPVLRGHALTQLSWSRRGEIAAEIMDRGSTEAKIYAIEVLANDSHATLEKTCRKLLKDAARASSRPAPELRYLWLQALKALDRRGLLSTADVLALMPLPSAKEAGNDKLQDEAKARIQQLVASVAKGLSARALAKAIDDLLDWVFANGLNPRLARLDRRQVEDQVRKRLEGLRSRRTDKSVQARIANSLLVYLTGFRLGVSLQDRAEFRPVVLLEEEILLALGRTRTKEAGDALARFLDEKQGNRLRAHAALAVGMLGKLEFARHLVPVLSDPDGFTRFCAYESLRHLTRRDVWADWMYGDETARSLAATQYRKLVGGR
ncbi:MAG: hypothetical protein H6836_07610 [Planctomycetes bacterium]|nr:hypothetical protein [Planctomycetota bacterium]MCB9889431.1 hypothetical protein [Planctomycetota bacterium]